jgi:hypothetical protein
MKKIALILILLCVSSSVFAQNVLDANGYDWVSWTSMEKQKYALGWMSSLSALRELTYYWQTEFEISEPTNNALDALNAWSFYKGSVNDFIILLDRVYTDSNAREYKLWDVILTIHEKEWWE